MPTLERPVPADQAPEENFEPIKLGVPAELVLPLCHGWSSCFGGERGCLVSSNAHPPSISFSRWRPAVLQKPTPPWACRATLHCSVQRSPRGLRGGGDSGVVQAARVAAGQLSDQPRSSAPSCPSRPRTGPSTATPSAPETTVVEATGLHPLEAWGSGRQKPGLQVGLGPHLCFSPRDGQVGGQEGLSLLGFLSSEHSS